MDTAELIKKVRKIEIKTRHLSSDLFSGSYHSAFKGRGMSFSEVRDYQYGDDVRNIDWNVTARMGEPHIKVFEEERELTVLLMIDLSGSSYFGTGEALRANWITELAAVLAFSAESNNDKIGAIFFDEEIRQYIAPRKGKKHILKLIRDLLAQSERGRSTDIPKAIQYAQNILQKRSIIFLLSDFVDQRYADALSILSRRHDVIGLRIQDPLDREWPRAGLLRLMDAETGRSKVVNTSSRRERKEFERWRDTGDAYFAEAFNRCRADRLDLLIGDPYVLDLVRLFKRRAR